MPYRIDLACADPSSANAAMDRLVARDALDVELSPDGRIAALMPDGVDPDELRSSFGTDSIAVSPAVARDDGSVWVLSRRAVRIGRLTIAPAGATTESGALQLIDGDTFGSGLHPTTALCLEAIEEIVLDASPAAILDVGTGSGILALGALRLGVPRAVALDVDEDALRVATENARLNGLTERVELVNGGPEAVTGAWPLVAANVLAAPLIEMAAALVQRVGHQGYVVLSGIPVAVGREVDVVYRHLGMRHVRATSRAGWVTIVLQAGW